MSASRAIVGLAVGSGYEAAEAVLVRVDGIGLAMTPDLIAHGRTPLPSDLRDAARRAAQSRESWPAESERRIADVLVVAARQVILSNRFDARTVTAIGLADFAPESPAAPDPAANLAEQTGLTVLTDFRSRDRAAGGTGKPISAAADFLLFRNPNEGRLLIHIGSTASLVWIPAGGKVSDVIGFEAGPGHRLPDEICHLGTRGREVFDHGGTKAVQGRCLEDLMRKWKSHPYLGRRPPKAVPPGAFGGAFVSDAFEAARSAGGTLADLLCTATEFVTWCVGAGARAWIPAAQGLATRRVLLSGGGARNGFLWKRLAAQFPGVELERTDAVGVPASARTAAGAAVMAALTLDGVAGNLPLFTGASGGRLLGRIIPGDPRNWAACTAWMARQMNDYLALGRAA